mgnify:CR=1 FL=1
MRTCDDERTFTAPHYSTVTIWQTSLKWAQNSPSAVVPYLLHQTLDSGDRGLSQHLRGRLDTPEPPHGAPGAFLCTLYRSADMICNARRCDHPCQVCVLIMRSDAIQTPRTTHVHRPVPLVPMAHLCWPRTWTLMTHPFWVIWPKSEWSPRVLWRRCTGCQTQLEATCCF